MHSAHQYPNRIKTVKSMSGPVIACEMPLFHWHNKGKPVVSPSKYCISEVHQKPNCWDYSLLALVNASDFCADLDHASVNCNRYQLASYGHIF